MCITAVLNFSPIKPRNFIFGRQQQRSIISVVNVNVLSKHLHSKDQTVQRRGNEALHVVSEEVKNITTLTTCRLLSTST